MKSLLLILMAIASMWIAYSVLFSVAPALTMIILALGFIFICWPAQQD